MKENFLYPRFLRPRIEEALVDSPVVLIHGPRQSGKTTFLALNAERLWRDRSIFGQMLETFVFQELQRHASWQEEAITFFHFRDKDKVEVDMVLESEGRVAGVEVKAVSTVTFQDFKGLRKLRDATRQAFAAGVVLYDGEALVGFGENLYAVPISNLWETE